MCINILHENVMMNKWCNIECLQRVYIDGDDIM